jgi:hypothetical protein
MGSVPLLIFLLTGVQDNSQAAPAPQQMVPSTTASTPASNTAATDKTVAPITASERAKWALVKTIGPGSLFVGAVQAGWGNLTDRPKEYGEGMEGFGKRFGLRLSSVGTSNLMEASLGSIWGEDPRYFRQDRDSNGGRFKHALKMTFMARRSDGNLAPAYARYIGYVGSNAISDAWRPDSQVNFSSTITRIGERFAGKLLGNLFQEYWPELKRHSFLNKH